MRLIDYLKPSSFDDIIGQDNILKSGAPLRVLIENGFFDCLIFIGPSGTGKTTTSRLIGEYFNLPFIEIHASEGTENLKKTYDKVSTYGSGALIFVDEAHRYNKVQQNYLLNLLDNKNAKIILASTENPNHSLVQAIRSRSYTFQFNKISKEDLIKLANRGLPYIYSQYDVKEIEGFSAVETLAALSSGDARYFMNHLSLLIMMGEKHGNKYILSQDFADSVSLNKVYDDEEHYGLLSAMIKSIRGSNPDASLLWAFKMLNVGVDPEVILRRLLILASEDIGNAYPEALMFTNAAYEAFTKVGFPEGEIIISHLVTYLASVPKSNRSYIAMHKVKSYLDNNSVEIPENIKQKSINYKYPHDYGGFIEQKYMNDDQIFYSPGKNGMELKFYERLLRLWKSKYNE